MTTQDVMGFTLALTWHPEQCWSLETETIKLQFYIVLGGGGGEENV